MEGFKKYLTVWVIFLSQYANAQLQKIEYLVECNGISKTTTNNLFETDTVNHLIDTSVVVQNFNFKVDITFLMYKNNYQTSVVKIDVIQYRLLDSTNNQLIFFDKKNDLETPFYIIKKDGLIKYFLFKKNISTEVKKIIKEAMANFSVYTTNTTIKREQSVYGDCTVKYFKEKNEVKKNYYLDTIKKTKNNIVIKNRGWGYAEIAFCKDLNIAYKVTAENQLFQKLREKEIGDTKISFSASLKHISIIAAKQSAAVIAAYNKSKINLTKTLLYGQLMKKTFIKPQGKIYWAVII